MGGGVWHKQVPGIHLAAFQAVDQEARSIKQRGLHWRGSAGGEKDKQ